MKKIYQQAAEVMCQMKIQELKGWDLNWRGPGIPAKLVSPRVHKFLKQLGLVGRSMRHGEFDSRIYCEALGRRLIELAEPDVHLVSVEDWQEALQRIDRLRKDGPYPELAQYGPTAISLMRDAWAKAVIHPANPWKPQGPRLFQLISDVWLLHDRSFISFAPVGGFRITLEGCYRYGIYVGQQSMVVICPPDMVNCRNTKMPDPKPGGPADYSLAG
jgi:hypothetical protein